MARKNEEPYEHQWFSKDDISDVMVICGPVFSELRIYWQVKREGGGPALFLHIIRLAHASGPISEAVHIENLFDPGPTPNFANTELFMRLESKISNGPERRIFTDQAGLGMVERTYVQDATIEGDISTT